jgi:hypothetical protein
MRGTLTVCGARTLQGGTAAWGCIAGARGDLVPVVADRERQLRVASTEAVDAAPTLRL